MKILVAGDIHGKLEQLRKVVNLIEPDAVFQVGDFGFFADKASMDRASRRHLEKNPAEGEIFSYINKKNIFPYPLYFVRGNHEDFDLLERFEALELPNIHYLKTGVHSIKTVALASIGGVHYWGHNPKKRDLPKYTQEEELEFLFRERKVDICLTHDAPEGLGSGRSGIGSPFVALAIETLKPKFCFHGHYAGFLEPYKNGDTQVYPMNMRPDRANNRGLFVVEEALLGLLAVESNEMKFHYLQEKDIKTPLS